jgi:hypothetical protein
MLPVDVNLERRGSHQAIGHNTANDFVYVASCTRTITSIRHEYAHVQVSSNRTCLASVVEHCGSPPFVKSTESTLTSLR